MESTIKKYTNSKGVSHDAHFNARGKYIGSVKKLGPVPIQLGQIAVPIQENKRDHAKIQELELENKQLREHIAKIEQQMANLYVIKNG